ncbi:AAA family ATPase [Streptomyces sp. NPDC088745]|uniref:AAA family ATPase n=1 Tax=Streptomyces sp. NPDC088745 TaxID=3365884 RepID=UPI00380C004E
MRLLTAGHAVDSVRGIAGVGKTTIMSAARVGWEAAGLRVVGTSTAAVAAANLAAEAGIDSQTIATWTHDITGGRGLAGGFVHFWGLWSTSCGHVRRVTVDLRMMLVEFARNSSDRRVVWSTVLCRGRSAATAG